MRRSFRAANYWRGRACWRSPKNTRKKRWISAMYSSGTRDKKGFNFRWERQPREPPVRLRTRPASNKILLQLDALHGADRDFTFCLPSPSCFDLAEGSHILLASSYLENFLPSEITCTAKQRSQLKLWKGIFEASFSDLIELILEILERSLTMQRYFKIILVKGEKCLQSYLFN